MISKIISGKKLRSSPPHAKKKNCVGGLLTNFYNDEFYPI